MKNKTLKRRIVNLFCIQFSANLLVLLMHLFKLTLL